MEKIYIGTKIIAAEPMSEKEWTVKRAIFNAPYLNTESAWREGKENREGYKVRYEDGYVSWSPKETFERTYREISKGEVDIFLPLVT